MAQRVEVKLIDDVDGGDAAETIRFGLDGSTYEIDLSPKNADKMRKVLEPWADKARKVSGRATSRSRSAAAVPAGRTSKERLTAIREWAKANNIEVSERGRIARTVVDAYDAAH